MSEELKRVSHIGGPAAKLAMAVGRRREIMVDTDSWELTIHDGETPGGHRTLGARGDGSHLKVTAPGATAPMDLADAFGDVVRARMFGAKGDGVTDDTAALQAAIAAVKALPASTRPRRLRLDPGNYFVTDSLDGTYPFAGTASSVQQGWTLEGAGPGQVKIIGALSTAHPILDMTGNSRGAITGVRIEAAAGSAASCGVLACRANNFHVSNSAVVMPSNIPGIVINNSDLAGADRSEFYGRDAVVVGGGALPAGIASKWQAIPAGLFDDTAHTFTDCIYNGARRAIWHTGGVGLTLLGGYAAVTGSAEGDPARSVCWFDASTIVQTKGLRIENQSSEIANAFGFALGTQGCNLTGYFDVGVADALVYIPATRYFVQSVLQSKNSYGAGPVFAGGGIVRGSAIRTNRTNLGTVDGAACGAIDLVGPALPSNFIAGGIRAFAQNTEIAGGSSVNRGGTLSRPIGNWLGNGTGIGGSYTGGSGLQAVGSVTIPSALFAQQSWATSVGTLPRVRVGFAGACQTNATPIRLRLVASQAGVADVPLVDWALPTVYAGELIEIEATISSLAANGGLRGYAKIFAGGSVSPGLYKNLQGAGFVGTSPVTLTVYFESAASAPIVFETLSGISE